MSLRRPSLGDLRRSRTGERLLRVARQSRTVLRQVEARAAPARRAGGRAGLRVAGLLALRHRAARRRDFEAMVQTATTAPHPVAEVDRSITVIVVGDDAGPRPGWFDGLPAGATVVAVAAGAPGPAVEQAVARAVAQAATDLVCIVRADAVPVETGWLASLIAALGREVVLVAPQVAHGERRWDRATPFDLRVREEGLVVDTSPDGTPVVRFRRAGAPVDPHGPVVDVVAASGTCVVFDRAAGEQVGGLDDPAAIDPAGIDAACIDLCLRLRAAGGAIRVVPSVVLVDGRGVREPADLRGPLGDDGAAWRSVVERHGRRVLAAEPGPISFVLTVASPSAKVAPQWGDWHLARALAAALVRAGHPAFVQTADRADSLRGRVADVHVVVRGLVPVPPTQGQRQVLWVISHPEAVTTEECDRADLVLVASSRFAAELRSRTATPVGVLLQATDAARFRPVPSDPAHRHPVTIVAKSRDVMRPMVAAAVAAGLRPAIYGSGWGGLVDPALVVAEHVPNEDLPVVYSSAGVVLNDHWDTMRDWGFVSNRVFDVLACGTPLVSDHLPELADLFDDLVATWETPTQLRAAVEEIAVDPAASAARAAEARRRVLAHHTFDVRAAELLAACRAHDLVPDRAANGGSNTVRGH